MIDTGVVLATFQKVCKRCNLSQIIPTTVQVFRDCSEFHACHRNKQLTCTHFSHTMVSGGRYPLTSSVLVTSYNGSNILQQFCLLSQQRKFADLLCLRKQYLESQRRENKALQGQSGNKPLAKVTTRGKEWGGMREKWPLPYTQTHSSYIVKLEVSSLQQMPLFKGLKIRDTGMVAHTYNPKTWEVEAGRTGISGHSSLYSKFKVPWGYMSHCLKNNKTTGTLSSSKTVHIILK